MYARKFFMKIPALALTGFFLLIGLAELYASTPDKSSVSAGHRTVQKITGTVVDDEGAPIEGVKLEMSDNGSPVVVMTGLGGVFAVNVSSDVTSMRFSAHGYADRKEVFVNNLPQEPLIVNMTRSTNYPVSADEEVFILHGSQKKDLVTGAYSQINGSRVENYGVTNNTLRLMGLLPGLLVQQNNGEPGDEGGSMWMRGKRTTRGKSPIILVDGYERPMNSLEPCEIEAVTILKDAAATARYGLRGSNGIVLITTKRGEPGKVKITANIRGGMKMPTVVPEYLDSYDYATLYNEAQRNDGRTALKYTDTHFRKYMDARNGILEDPNDFYLYPNVNWYKDFTQDAWQQRYSVNLSGGNEYARYFVAGGYLQNSGMYKTDKKANTYDTNSYQDLLTLRSNVDINVTKRFSLSLDISGKQDQRRFAGTDSESSLNIFRALTKTPPNAFPVMHKGFDPATGFQMLGGTKDYTENIYGRLNRMGYTLWMSRQMTATLKSMSHLDFITEGLYFRAEVAFDSEYSLYTRRDKSYSTWGINQLADGSAQYPEGHANYYYKTGNDTQMGTGGAYGTVYRRMNYRFGFHYGRNFGDHRIFTEALFNERTLDDEDNTNLARVYRGGDGMISYQYKDKYLLDFSLGIMGSEQFTRKNRFGFFPAVSAGWIVTQESFLKDSPVFSFIKLRGSVGQTGWDDTGGYFLWFQQFGSSGSTQFGLTAMDAAGWNESAFAMDNVTWEKCLKINVGLDLRLFNDRVALTADVFKENNRDIMRAPESLPYLMGIRFPDFPIGKVENKGLDGSLSYRDKIGNVRFSLSATIGTAVNKITEMGEAPRPFPYQNRTGRQIDAVFGLVDLGLFQSEADVTNSPKQTFAAVVRPGEIKYKDMNDDGVIDAYDETYLGNNADPTLQGGVHLGLEWKGFDLSVLTTMQNGGFLRLEGEVMYEFHDMGRVSKHHLDRFIPEDPTTFTTATYPRLTLENKQNNQRQSTYWRTNARLIRLKNFEVGYSFPTGWSKNTLNRLRLYVNAYNWLTWQQTNLTDVESRVTHGVYYPIQKIVNVGLNVTF